ncbi:MAG: acyltransferase [Oscillospiraceae bacterium]|nr:acyltransferase [Oscillospiraceae bacterium]
MRRKINNVISVLYTIIRVLIFKIILSNSFSSGIIERISPNVVLEFNKGSTVLLGKKIRVHSGSKIKTRKGARLIIGDNVKINYNCIIVCQDSISIGSGTEFGPSVYLYDHDHDYRKGLSSNSNDETFKRAPIKIGEKCWIGANTVILRGTELGDNCVVGAGCVLNGKYESNSVIVQKRNTVVL